ncbi:MAG: thermonuclease family protein [Pirellula sp.]
MVFRKTVAVQSKGTDRYGRTLVVISVGDTNVNQQLVAGRGITPVRIRRWLGWNRRRNPPAPVSGPTPIRCHRGTSARGDEAGADSVNDRRSRQTDPATRPDRPEAPGRPFFPGNA